MISHGLFFTLFFLVIAMTTVRSRSLLHIINDAINNNNDDDGGQNSSAPSYSYSDSDSAIMPQEESQERQHNDISRPRRDASSSYSSAAGNCPVMPDTAVLLGDNLHFFNFSWNDNQPETPANQSLQCPKNQYTDWWPAPEPINYDNLRASCPWILVNKEMFRDDIEVYPRYVQEAKHLCTRCVNAKGMGCKALERDQVVYKKIGCDGEHPIFQKFIQKIKVGFFCHVG